MEGYARLLGAPQLRFGSASFEPPVSKSTALLFYLAQRGGWCSRDELVFLFYPDSSEDAARRNLRQLLSSIKRLPYSQGLVVEVTRVRWPIVTDVHGFKQAVGEARWAQALELHQGEFLQGVELAGAPEFEAWLELERAEIHRVWLEAVTQHARELMAADRHAEAAAVTAFCLNAADFHEDVFHLHLGATYLAGERGLALVAYRGFVGRMRAELGLDPTSVTERLAHAVQTTDDALLRQVLGLAPRSTLDVEGSPSATVSVVGMPVATRARSGPAPSLPRVATAFVDRPELAGLHEALQQPACQLLTLLGPGGVGKTRLALELAHEVRAGSRFGHDVYFVSLESLSRPEDVPASLVGALGLPPARREEEPLGRVVAHLRDTPALLVLDNLEHLLGAVDWVSELVRACPELKVVVTSRERLQLVEEWVFSVGGLEVPEAGVRWEDALANQAVRLFSQTAKRVRHDFELEPADLPLLTKLLGLVEGVPLAIELAAVWVRVLQLEQITAAIEADIDFLSTAVHNVPERHRSMRAAFEHSWRLLSRGEQVVLRRLSVFRGGFTQEAAEEVAGAKLPVLAALVDKSLVRLTQGRYDRHPLLHQYALEKLEEDPGETAAARERHANYFVGFAEEERRKAELARLEVEHDNLRQALAWAEANEQAGLGLRLAVALFWFWWQRGHVREGRAWLERMLALAPLGRTVDRVHALWRAATLMDMQGEWELVQTLHEEGLGIARELGDAMLVADALQRLGVIAYDRGEYEKARTSFEESLRLRRARGGGGGSAAPLMGLGVIAFVLGDHDRARALYEESLGLMRDEGDAHAIAGALGSLGLLAREEGDDAAAWSRLEEALRMHRASGNEWSVARNLSNLGLVAVDRGDLPLARTLQAEALKTTWASGIVKTLNRSFEAIAMIMLREEEFEQAALLWGAAESLREATKSPMRPYQQPAYDEALAALRAGLDGVGLAEAWQQGRAMPLADAVAYALEALERA